MPGAHVLSPESAEFMKLTGEKFNPLFRYRLDADGDGTGTKDMATTADEYYRMPSTGQVLVVNSIDFYIEDDGDIPMNFFGALGAALTNGILLKVKRANADLTGSSVLIDLLDGLSIKKNADLNMVGRVDFTVDTTGVSVIKCHIDMNELLGYPLRLTEFDYVSVQTQDDLSNLEHMYVFINGGIFKAN